ncbi:hypothetical protein HHX47_DHR4000713 [Lentinula edodes]|nr:hypothetical protein HHX47_DHR4000713 [Lentinula edodes]
MQQKDPSDEVLLDFYPGEVAQLPSSFQLAMYGYLPQHHSLKTQNYLLDRWIIAADIVHHLFIGQYKKEYPEAKVIGVEGLREKKKQSKEDLIIDGEYGTDPPETLYGFENEIKACFFSGFANKDIAFLHVATKTLIVADLLFNLPGTEQYSKSKISPKVPIIGKLNPTSTILKRLLWTIGKDKDAMRRDAKIVREWDFERIIMCHGDVIETGGQRAWEEAYSKYLS